MSRPKARVGRAYDAPCTCPHCGHRHDVASKVLGRGKPQAGNLSICIACTKLGVFTEDGTLRLPTARELFQLLMSDDWPEIEKVQLAIRLTHRELGRPK
jgi:hypothetical protein